MPTDTLEEDDFFSSPMPRVYPTATLKENASKPRSHAFEDDDDDDGLFQVAASSTFLPPSSSPMPLRTPVKQTLYAKHLPDRPILSVRTTNSPFMSTAATGTKRKPPAYSFTTPERKHMLTPLSTTSAQQDGDDEFNIFAFDRLTAPKFGVVRTPQTRAETELYLKKQEDSMTRLKIVDRDCSGEEAGYDSGVEMGQSDEVTCMRLFNEETSSSVGRGKAAAHAAGLSLVTKKSLVKEEEVVESMSPGGHINKRRARSRPVSQELLSAANTPAFKSTQKYAATSHMSASKTTGSIAFPSNSNLRGRRQSNSSSSSVEVGSPRPRTRLTSGSLKSRNQSQASHQRIPLNRLTSASSATLFFGPTIPQPESRAKKQSTGAMNIDEPETSARPGVNSRHSYPGSPNESPWKFAARGSPSDGALDEADLFFNSPPEKSFTFSLTESTPSPTKKQHLEPVEQLPKKYRPRDSGIALDDDISDDDGRPGLMALSSEHGSGSMSSLNSESEGEALVTPGCAPGPDSGWPGVGIVSLDDELYGGLDGDAGEDAFIIRTLTSGTKPSPPVPGEPQRVPGTPVKRNKTAHLLERPWQSAIATKIGFPGFDAVAQDKKSRPRKSLPAAFPTVGRDLRQRRNALTFNNSMGGMDTENEHENEDEEASPSTRKEARYNGLGIGKPPVPLFARSAGPKFRAPWLMRRTSSGAFSSGSETTTSNNTTPTRATVKDLQLHVPPVESPLKKTCQLSSSQCSSQSTSTSGTSTVANSPIVEAVARRCPATEGPQHRRGRSQGQAFDFNKNASPKKGRPRSGHLPGSALRGRPSLPNSEERPGRFEQDFVELDELGRGEFGRVMKVRYNEEGSEETFAVKKSKPFEGVRHRLRLREEVDILKHLSQVASASGLGISHPNVLGYRDSWEEDETLFIQTELCALGNLSNFLWKYGRAYPKLNESRVWKIIAELSSGLSFIHDAGAIHLDLKPANIFVTSDGRFKIGDFGMASIWPRPAPKQDANGIPESTSFEREGDKLYLAPEVLQGKYSKAADIFSFGMTMLETATNIVVPDQGEAWHRLRHEDFQQVDFGNCSNELVELLKNMMRSDPALRMDAKMVYDHPVASALAGVREGWLEEVLGHVEMWDADEGDEAMDLEF
ncbi:hypothetical protein EW026_g331 [Hermanssonia centrifuga]|uniref:Protein kinase domain-containing protein n=1 Tax=Hermanssonia centrifuga TaxID=98765 RepID=A0A4S4KV08_9APHY|nr:hypothetical protein EW026_g331 [Hermanssonia centrifuga]